MKYLKKLIPPDDWKLAVSIAMGVFVGLFFYTVYISNAVSYLSDDPKTCINCHIMNPEFAAWQHSSHREQATCNDCHVPHDNVFNKYFFKAKDGLRHATLFTLGKEAQSIFIENAGKGVVQGNCERCHDHLNEIVKTDVTFEEHQQGKGKLCWDCHQEVPHGSVNSLSSISFMIDRENERVPDWLNKKLKK